jgi:hypothetical protein
LLLLFYDDDDIDRDDVTKDAMPPINPMTVVNRMNQKFNKTSVFSVCRGEASSSSDKILYEVRSHFF